MLARKEAEEVLSFCWTTSHASIVDIYRDILEVTGRKIPGEPDDMIESLDDVEVNQIYEWMARHPFYKPSVDKARS